MILGFWRMQILCLFAMQAHFVKLTISRKKKSPFIQVLFYTVVIIKKIVIKAVSKGEVENNEKRTRLINCSIRPIRCW